MHRQSRVHAVRLVACLIAVASAAAQPAPAPDPLVKENATVKLAEHTYVIPDNNVPLVPNVGIIVGSRATLVIDPGLGRRNGEAVLREVAKVSRNTELFIATTHFHAEHTTGYLAFPAGAKYVSSSVQEAEFAEGGAQQIQAFSRRSPMTAELLKDATGRKADITFDRDYVLDLGGVRVRLLVVGPTHTRGDTGMFVEGDAVLFSGDVVMNNSFHAATQVSSMKAWLAAFDAFEADAPEDRRAVPRRRRRLVDHRGQPRDHGAGEGARARTEGPGPFSRRGRDDGAEGAPGRASGVAARQWPRGSGPQRLRRSAVGRKNKWSRFRSNGTGTCDATASAGSSADSASSPR